MKTRTTKKEERSKRETRKGRNKKKEMKNNTKTVKTENLLKVIEWCYCCVSFYTRVVEMKKNGIKVE